MNLYSIISIAPWLRTDKSAVPFFHKEYVMGDMMRHEVARMHRMNHNIRFGDRSGVSCASFTNLEVFKKLRNFSHFISSLLVS